MMFATPVRSSAWSSTSSTLDAAAAPDAISADSMDLRRQRRGFPREDDLGPAARRGDDRERRADALRSLLHARHPESGRRFTSDSPPIVRHRQAEPNRLDG